MRRLYIPGRAGVGRFRLSGREQVAEDLGIRKWWSPTREMERYIKTYLE